MDSYQRKRKEFEPTIKHSFGEPDTEGFRKISFECDSKLEAEVKKIERQILEKLKPFVEASTDFCVSEPHIERDGYMSGFDENYINLLVDHGLGIDFSTAMKPETKIALLALEDRNLDLIQEGLS